MLLTVGIGNSNCAFTQQRNWVSLSEEVDSPVHTLNVFQGQMFVGGHFINAGQHRVNYVALWDGTTYHKMDRGLQGGYNPFAYDSKIWNGDLYVVGNFDSAGFAKCNDIARWDGTSWHSLSIGSNKSILAIAEYSGDLIVSGQFDSIGGIEAQRIARWDGSSWHPLGTGIDGTSVNSLCVYNGKLYAAGPFDTVAGIYCKNIAVWDGFTWDSVGSGLRWPNTAMIEWQGKLLVGSMDDVFNGDYEPQVHAWDNNEWKLYSKQKMMPDLTMFIEYQGMLYCAGGQGTNVPLSLNQNRVAFWNADSSKWENAGNGINHRTKALCVYKDELYCGGYFNQERESPHNFIAKYSEVTGISDAEQPSITLKIWPNPSYDVQHMELMEGTNVSYTLLDAYGRAVKKGYIGNVEAKRQLDIDLSELSDGMYHYLVRANEYEITRKSIKTSN